MGQPGRYTFCFGENEEESPWEPLHVERGFKREDSTVTIISIISPINTVARSKDYEGILTCLADAMAYMGNINVIYGMGMVLVDLAYLVP